MMKKRKLGIIGGSGLYKMDGFEKTDSIVVVISEQTGKIVYFKGGEYIKIKSREMLNELVIQDLNK